MSTSERQEPRFTRSERQRRQEGNGSLPPAPKLALPPHDDNLGTTAHESTEQVLARYGKPVKQVPSIMMAATEATRRSGQKLVDDSHASILAAEKILQMLKAEHEEFSAEVMRHTNNFAARVEAFFGTCFGAINAMSHSREEMLKVSQVIADNPIAPLAPTEQNPIEPIDPKPGESR